MSHVRGRGVLVGLLSLVVVSSTAVAQDDPFGEDVDDIGAPEADAAPEEAEASGEEAAPEEGIDEEPAAEPEPEPEPEGAEVSAEADASVDASLGLSASADAEADTDAVDTRPAKPETAGPALVTGSHIRRPRLMTDEGVLFIGSPLRTTFEGQESLQLRRQLSGIAMPDTTAALGHGASSTMSLELRSQPTLILLNGRRLVSAPFWGRQGFDFVDLNQLPLALIDHVETTSGMAAGLYGDGALGGVVNYITHRDYEGVEVEVGGQVTDDLDQHDADVTVALGAGTEKTGMNVMLHYFDRSPLDASDPEWMGERLERHESILGHPASYQGLLNFVDYPFADPACGVATNVGDATGVELRVPLFGEPVTRSGGNALDLLPVDTTMDPPLDYAMRYIEEWDRARGNANGWLDANETSSYCGNDLTRFQDLILEEERVQTYATFWHAFSDHTEAFGEAGYYRNENRNRTSPSFPVIRITPSDTNLDPVEVPTEHADVPLQFFGFNTQQGAAPEARVANNFFIVGSPLALHAGGNVNERRIDTFRGVLGLKGDLEDVGEGSVLESWDWELAGVYSTSEAISRVPDILLDKLGEALDSCDKTRIDQDVSSATYGMEIPTTIKDRQEAGCFNPFYNSVTNNVAVDPLNLSNASVENVRGFIASDSETVRTEDGYGIQDGGYICDPADPNFPCSSDFDSNGDGYFDLAGTPNTQQVVEGMIGDHITQERRSLSTVDLLLRGDLAEFGGGGLGFGLGGQFRRETLSIDYDAAFNQRRYAFVFGAPDVEPVGRNVAAGFGELRLTVLDGLLEVQAAGRAEHYENVGMEINPLGGIALRPMAAAKGSPLEWLVVRGHAGLGHRAPTLLQQYGTYTQFHAVEFLAGDHFIPHQVRGNEDLDFEKYTTFSGGLQWDYVGIHVAGDFWMTMIDDVIGADNTQTLLTDCENQFLAISVDCRETHFVEGGRTINHVESPFENLAEVETNGIDGGVSYTLDTKRRGMGELGTFVVGAQGRYINSYLIKSARALREYYRLSGSVLVFNPDGTRDYSQVQAEYEAAGYRNLENFAPPMPQLRFSVPLRWMYEGHTIGATMRYVGSYYDDSESTIEKYGLTQTLAAPRAPGTVPFSDGEEIPAWVVFDLGYSISFGSDGWKSQLALGVLNLLDEPPPATESPLAYDVGVHDPRGRMVYARLKGEF